MEYLNFVLKEILITYLQVIFIFIDQKIYFNFSLGEIMRKEVKNNNRKVSGDYLMNSARQKHENNIII